MSMSMKETNERNGLHADNGGAVKVFLVSCLLLLDDPAYLPFQHQHQRRFKARSNFEDDWASCTQNLPRNDKTLFTCTSATSNTFYPTAQSKQGPSNTHQKRCQSFNHTCRLGRQSTTKNGNFCRCLKREDCAFPSSPEAASTSLVPAPAPPSCSSLMPAPSKRPRPLPVTPVTSSFALTARHSCGSVSSVGAASSPELCRGSDAGRVS